MRSLQPGKVVFLRVLSYAFVSYVAQILRLNLRPSRDLNRLTVSSCLLLHTLQLDWTYLFISNFARFCAAKRRIFTRVLERRRVEEKGDDKQEQKTQIQRFSAAFTTHLCADAVAPWKPPLSG